MSATNFFYWFHIWFHMDWPICDSDEETSEVDSGDSELGSSGSELSETTVLKLVGWKIYHLARKMDFYSPDGRSIDSVSSDSKKHVSWFSFLFPEEIVRKTKRQEKVLFCDPGISEGTRMARWKNLSVDELRVFQFYSYPIKVATSGSVDVRIIEKTSHLCNIPLVREFMFRDRFLSILHCLHFGKEPTMGNQILKTGCTKCNLRKTINNKNDKCVFVPSKEHSIN